MEWPNYFAGEHRTVYRETIRRCTDFQDAILLELETSHRAPVYTDWRLWYPEGVVAAVRLVPQTPSLAAAQESLHQ